MKLLVCIKQVPDMESRFQPNDSGDWYAETDLAYRMNEYDEYAVEEAVRLKEQLGSEPDVTALSIGPDRSGEPLRRALAMGCDRAVHIRDPAPHKKDPWQIAAIIAAYARDKGYDLIFTGMQSQDRGSAQVGVTVAEELGYSCATTIIGFACDSGAVTVRRELEGGLKGVVKLRLPALVTCQLGLNMPRYPTLPGILKAKKKEMLSHPVSEFLREQGLTATTGVYPPTKRGGGIILEGEVSAMAEQLFTILRENTAAVR